MPAFAITTAPNLTFNIDYLTNGKVTGFTCINNTGVQVYGQAILTDGRLFGQVFGAGSTPVSFPVSVVSLTFDAQGEAIFNGLDSFGTTVPG